MIAMYTDATDAKSCSSEQKNSKVLGILLQVAEHQVWNTTIRLALLQKWLFEQAFLYVTRVLIC